VCAEGYAGNLCAVCASGQGLTLVHFSAQLKHFLLGRGCIQRLFVGIVGCVGCILCQKRLRFSWEVDE